MRATAEHKILFHGEDGEEFPDLNNPIYLYNIGDKFTLHFFDEETEVPMVHEFEVTNIKHEVHSIIDCEQRIIVSVKRIE